MKNTPPKRKTRGYFYNFDTFKVYIIENARNIPRPTIYSFDMVVDQID